MSKIGYLKPFYNGSIEELHGEIRTLQMQLRVKFIPNNKTSDNAPDYAITAVGPNGSDVQIGGAWKKEKQQIGDVLLEFLSITIDDPSLPTALNVAAFKKDDGSYDITWRRRQANQTNEDAASAA